MHSFMYDFFLPVLYLWALVGQYILGEVVEAHSFSLLYGRG